MVPMENTADTIGKKWVSSGATLRVCGLWDTYFIDHSHSRERYTDAAGPHSPLFELA